MQKLLPFEKVGLVCQGFLTAGQSVLYYLGTLCHLFQQLKVVTECFGLVLGQKVLGRLNMDILTPHALDREHKPNLPQLLWHHEDADGCYVHTINHFGDVEEREWHIEQTPWH